MPSPQVQVHGLEQLEHLGKKLKGAEKELTKELRRNIRIAVAPVKVEIRNSLREGLPKRGGLAAFMGNASVGARVSTGGRNVGVRIVAAKKGHDLKKLDEGEIRHPTYGRKPWVRQSVKEHLVSGPVEKARPEIHAGVLKAMDTTSHRITH
jgi:hypothetical protein